MEKLKGDIQVATDRIATWRCSTPDDPLNCVKEEIFNQIKYRVSEMSYTSQKYHGCQQYEVEINDPCVSVGYDAVQHKCRVLYTCKIVRLTDEQRTVAPITKDEATEKLKTSLKSSKKKRPQKIVYL
jgi:hypothetical protein